MRAQYEIAVPPASPAAPDRLTALKGLALAVDLTAPVLALARTNQADGISPAWASLETAYRTADQALDHAMAMASDIETQIETLKPKVHIGRWRTQCAETGDTVYKPIFATRREEVEKEVGARIGPIGEGIMERWGAIKIAELERQQAAYDAEAARLGLSEWERLEKDAGHRCDELWQAIVDYLPANLAEVSARNAMFRQRMEEGFEISDHDLLRIFS